MNTIYITGGEYGGRKIATPGGATHPMGSRERLALFNKLTGKFEGARILDVFAGSGALGIEALSRGAKEAVFVEKSREAADVIMQNLANLKIENAKVIKSSLEEVILKAFDIVIADPPYDKFSEKMVEKLPELVEKGGILVLSHPGEAPEFEGLKLIDSRKYAGATISFYNKD